MERVDVVCWNQPASAGVVVVVVGNSEFVIIRGPIHRSVRFVGRRSSFELFERCFINHNNHINNNDGSKPPRSPSLLSWLAVLPYHAFFRVESSFARESRRLILLQLGRPNEMIGTRLKNESLFGIGRYQQATMI
jgi:hypothetical protein